MKPSFFHIVVVLGILASAAGCAGDTQEDHGSCIAEPEPRVSSAVSAVVRGNKSPPIFELSTAEQFAVGKFSTIAETHERICSGALVTPDLVLTAAHCFGFERFYVDEEPRLIRGESAHPERDLLLVQLEPSADSRTVNPLPLLEQGIDSRWEGVVGLFAGFGLTEMRELGQLRYLPTRVDKVSSQTIEVDGGGWAGPCHGDSGGPLLVLASDGSVRVAGILSAGSASCVGRDVFEATALDDPWLLERVGIRPTHQTEGCRGLGAEGACIGEGALWCDDATLHFERCSGSLTCGYSRQEGGYRCVDSQLDACQGTDSFGECDGEDAVWCQQGERKRETCGLCAVCRHDSTLGRVTCVPNRVVSSTR